MAAMEGNNDSYNMCARLLENPEMLALTLIATLGATMLRMFSSARERFAASVRTSEFYEANEESRRYFDPNGPSVSPAQRHEVEAIKARYGVRQ